MGPVDLDHERRLGDFDVDVRIDLRVLRREPNRHGVDHVVGDAHVVEVGPMICVSVSRMDSNDTAG